VERLLLLIDDRFYPMFNLGAGDIVEPAATLRSAHERRRMQGRGDRINVSAERCFIRCGLPAVVFQSGNVQAWCLYQFLANFDAPSRELQTELNLHVRQTGTGHIVVQVYLDFVIDLSGIETERCGILH
jgi:hypothetical protein